MKTALLLFALLLAACSVEAGQGPGKDDSAPGNGNGNGGNANGNANGGNAYQGNANGGSANADASANGNGNGHAASDGNPGGAGVGTAGEGNAGGNGDAGGEATSNGAAGSASGAAGTQGGAGEDARNGAGNGNRPADNGNARPAGPAPHAPVQGDGAAAPGRPAHAGGPGSPPATHGAAPSAGEGPTGAASAPPVPASVPAVTEANAALHVQRGASGNLLAWDAPTAAAAQVQVWRLDPQGWVPVAVTTSGGQAFDAAGLQHSEYRLTWSEQPLGAGALASVATTLSFAPAMREAGSGIGALLLGLLWAGAGVFATVRTAPGPRRVNEGRVADDNQLLPILAGVPGIDVAALDRVVSLGLRTVGQLRRLDADAVAFWAGLPAGMVRTWKETIDLMQWSALPPGAAQRLALAGHATLAQVAAAQPADIMASLHSGISAVVGPGMPSDEQEVVNWVVEARQALGLPMLERAAAPAAAATAQPATA